MKKFFSILIGGMLAGFMIGVGGTVFLSCDNKYIGAFLFSLGLLTIVQFQLNLYTGKVGYIVDNEPKYIGDVLLILLGNAIGTFLCASAIRLSRYWPILQEKVAAIVNSKANDTWCSTLILAIFCGLLMYIAVHGFKTATANRHTTTAMFIVIMPVIVFILAGFNHSIADMFYVFLNGNITINVIKYLLIVILGNACGGIILPLYGKLQSSAQK